jgi:hypothetical protein|tara:strand:- start:213 stop:1001 length:789 start_codon:yes stop_codon:yes gene_type:complete
VVWIKIRRQSMPRIHKTKNYDQFAIIDWNRDIVPTHVAKVMKSMHQIGNITDLVPLIVWPKDKKYADSKNPEGRYPIIDGQYRFVSLKLNSDVVHYVIDESKRLSPEDVAHLQVSKNWAWNDYMNYYCKLGKQQYKIYAGFKSKSGWSHNCVIILLAGNTKGAMSSFKEGSLRITRTIEEANKIIEMINDFSEYFSYYKARSFVTAMLRIIDLVPEYDHNRMMQKMQYLSERLVKCPDAESYVLLLERLYNFKSTGNPVRFM